ncbi:MAG: DUF4178 domain-containing protein [Armatimonadota bacterium]
MIRKPQSPCPGCGAFARVSKEGRSTCAYCGATLPPLPFTHAGGICELDSPLRIGLRGRLEGKEYVIVGRLSYDETQDDETWQWDEWVLLSQDGEARYLEYDEGKWTLAQAWLDGPDYESAFAQVGNEVTVSTGTAKIVEEGTGRLCGAEGEIPWPIRIGERVRYAEFKGPGIAKLSVEWSGGGDAEWYRGRPMTNLEVLQTFGLATMLEEQVRIEATKTDRKRFGCLGVLLALVSLVGWGWADRGTGMVVAQATVPSSRLADPTPVIQGVPLSPANRVHRLSLRTTGLSQSSLWVQALLEDAEGLSVDTDAEFWDETGFDEDGAWHESYVSSDMDFRVVKQGTYAVKLVADPETVGANYPVTVVLTARGMHPAPLLAFGIGSLCVGALSLILAQTLKPTWARKGPGFLESLGRRYGP